MVKEELELSLWNKRNRMAFIDNLYCGIKSLRVKSHVRLTTVIDARLVSRPNMARGSADTQCEEHAELDRIQTNLSIRHESFVSSYYSSMTADHGARILHPPHNKVTDI